MGEKGLMQAIRRFGKQRVLVIGDVMLDRYLSGSVNRISPEAPVPILDLHDDDCRLGGAANVAANLVALGAESCTLISAIGHDEDGSILSRLLTKSHRIWSEVMIVSSHPTMVKTRIVSGTHQLMRIDKGRNLFMMPELTQSLLEKIGRILVEKKITAVILSDYGKGFISQKLITGVLKKAKDLKIPVMLDPKNNALRAKGMALVTPNLREAYLAAGKPYFAMTGHPEEINEAMRVVAERLHKKWKPCALAIKMGDKGIHVSWAGGCISKVIPASNVVLSDVCGAGDTVIAAMTLALVSGLGIETSADIGNKAAGVVVSKFGTSTCDWTELREVILSRNGTI